MKTETPCHTTNDNIENENKISQNKMAYEKRDPVEAAITEKYQKVIQVLEYRTPKGETKWFKWDTVYNDAVCQISGLDIDLNDIRIKNPVLQRLLYNRVVQNGAEGEIVFTNRA
jgi:hypothetical protein